MEITGIQIQKVFDTGPIRAIISVIIDDAFVIHDIKIIQTDRMFVGMPSRIDERGTFRDIVHPVNSEARRYVENQIIAAYIEHITNDSLTAKYDTNGDKTQSVTLPETTDSVPVEKAKPKISGTLGVKNNVFKISDTIPEGYIIWNLGEKMPTGYLPVGKPTGKILSDGTRELEKDTLVAIPISEAQLILGLVNDSLTTIRKMSAYAHRYKYRAKSRAVKLRVLHCEIAIHALQKIPGADTLIE